MPEIEGENGTWLWSVVGGPPDTISFTYFPKPGDCADIRLSQRVTKTAYDANGGIVTRKTGDMFKPGRPNPFGHADDDTIDRTITGAPTPPTYIDHHACEGDPYYNGDDQLLERRSRGDATKTPPTFTRITDNPGGSLDDVKDEIVRIDSEFETCAICAETGRILGCVRWVGRVTRDHPGRVAVITRDRDAPASNAFLAAFHRFCQTHTARDSNGKLRFRCAEGPITVEGQTIPPERGEVPGPFGRYWVQASRRLDLTRELAGGGSRFGALDDALAACAERPANAAIKLTWAGLQDKTRRSLVFTSCAGLEAADLEPFVDDELAMCNDFLDLDAVPVTPAFIGALARSFLETAGKALRSSVPVRLAAIAGAGTDDARSFTGPVEPKAVGLALQAAARTLDPEDYQVREAIVYALLTFARTPGAGPSERPGKRAAK